MAKIIGSKTGKGVPSGKKSGTVAGGTSKSAGKGSAQFGGRYSSGGKL